jgi:hypothetical protein
MRLIYPLALLLIACPAEAGEGGDRDWQFSLEPYVLASSISGDATVGRASGVAVDVSFSDILENLEMAAMVHFEAQHTSGWGVIFDYGFMDLGADTSVGFGGVVDANVRQGILELLASRELDVAAGSLQLLGGVRWWDNRVKARFDPALINGSVTTEISEDWVDPVVGLRWTHDLADRWQVRLRGDIGGFGVGSDFSWGASATAFYSMGDRYLLEFGYMALDVDYDNDKAASAGAFAYDTTTYGPLLGLVINF